MDPKTVTDALARLISLDGEFEDLLREARECLREVQIAEPWGPTALLQLDDVERVLELILKGAMEADQIQEWADILEMSDFVDYESGAEDVIAEVLFRAASPEINGPMTEEHARELLTSVRARRFRRDQDLET